MRGLRCGASAASPEALDPALLAPVIHDTPDRMDSVQLTIHDIEAEEQSLLAAKQTYVEATSAPGAGCGAASCWRLFWTFFCWFAAFEQLVRASRASERIEASAEEIANFEPATDRG